MGRISNNQDLLVLDCLQPLCWLKYMFCQNVYFNEHDGGSQSKTSTL